MRLMKLHERYIINRINLIIIFIILFLSVILNIILINPFGGLEKQWINRFNISDIYETYFLLFIRMISVLFCVYLFGSSFYKQNDDYSLLVLLRKNVFVYYSTKITCLMFISLIFSLINIAIHISIGYLFASWYSFRAFVLKECLYIYILSSVYGLISVFVIRKFKSIYSLLMPIVLYVISEIFLDLDVDSLFFASYQLFFPSLYENGSSVLLFFGFVHLVLLFVFYFIISFIVYSKKE